MSRTWLHLSAPRFQRQDDDAADAARNALIRLVGAQRSKGLCPDLIILTGDLAATGAQEEYERVTPFLAQLLEGVGLPGRRERVVVVPGDHDVQRRRTSKVMIRSFPLSSGEADEYFGSGHVRPHFMLQAEFRRWYDDFYTGIRTAPTDTTCGDVLDIDAGGGVRIAFLPINTALFAHRPEHHGKLWIGRPPLRTAARALASTPASLRIAVMHHPPEWLGDGERGWATATLTESADVLLHGHVLEPSAEISTSAQASILRVAASPCAGSSKHHCVFYGSFVDGSIQLRPFSYDDSSERWVLDTSVFPDAVREGYAGIFPIRRPLPPEATPAHKSFSPPRSRHHLFPRRRECSYGPEQKRRVLSMRAERQGDRVTWRYSVHDEDHFVAPVEIAGANAVIAEAQDWLRRPTPEKTARVGERLAGLLFGDHSQPGLQRVLRRLFGKPENDEELLLGLSYAPVRCRIHTSDPELRALPYSLLAVEGFHLADEGWTFELATPVPASERRPAIELRCPCTMLLIVPRTTARMHDPDAHLRDIDELLAVAWPLEQERGRVRLHRLVARSRADIEHHLQTHSPGVVYIFAKVDATDEQPTIQLDRDLGSEFVDLKELVASFPDTSVVFVNALGVRSRQLSQCEFFAPSCVVAPVAAIATKEAAMIGLAWLEAVLRRGYSPVAGLDVVQRERSSARAAAMLAQTRYQSWRTTPAPSEDFVAKVTVSLDRTSQRTLLLDRVRSLVTSTRRVLTVLAPATADQQPDKLPQLLHLHAHREIRNEPLRILHESLPLPRPGPSFRKDLEEQLADGLLMLDPGEGIELGLIRYLDDQRTRLGLRVNVKPVLWIEWQARDPQHAALRKVIEDLLYFATEQLAPQCPGKLAIISLLTIVGSESGCDALVDFCEIELRDPHGPRVNSASAGFVLLPRLGDVSRHDVDDYLFEHASCPNDLAQAVGASIFARTRGHYEQTVTLLEDLERTGSWSAIAAEAPRPTKRKPKSFL